MITGAAQVDGAKFLVVSAADGPMTNKTRRTRSTC